MKNKYQTYFRAANGFMWHLLDDDLTNGSYRCKSLCGAYAYKNAVSIQELNHAPDSKYCTRCNWIRCGKPLSEWGKPIKSKDNEKEALKKKRQTLDEACEKALKDYQSKKAELELLSKNDALETGLINNRKKNKRRGRYSTV
jgi:hypothetical protein